MRRGLLYIFLILGIVACRDKRTLVYVGGTPLKVEIADSYDERSRGLSGRTRMDGGMLFIFDKADRYPFWMRETYLPLSIAFIDKDGVIVSIQYMDPKYKNRMYIPPQPILYALEVKMGWFERHGVTVGDSLLMSGMKKS